VTNPTIWSILGIAPTQDPRLIRRAYAAALKRTNPDDDPKGFALLRAAYERALRQAREADRGDPPGAANDPGAPAAREPPRIPDNRPEASSASVSSPSDLDQLRSAFFSLQRLVTAAQVPDMEDMRAALEACIRSPALSNLSVQLEFEAAMARFLLQTQPRTEALLAAVIERWNWRLRLQSAEGGDAISAVVTLAENVNVLEAARASSPRAYLALTTPPRPALLWTQMVAYRLDCAVRDLMGRLRPELLPASVAPQALAWWSQFFARPRPRPALIRFAGVLAALGTLAGVVVGLYQWVLSDVWKGALAGVLAGLALVGLFFGLVDWPRHFFRTTRRAASPWVTLGWAPAGMLMCLISGLCPATPAIILSAFALSFALVFWAMLMTPEGAELGERTLSLIWGRLLMNVPVAVWWLLLTGVPEAAPTFAMWPVFAATLIAFIVGQPLLRREFAGLSREGRQSARFGIGAVAMGSIPALLYLPVRPSWSGLLLAYLFSVVLAHRTAALNLSVNQVKLRYYLTVVPAWLLALNRNFLPDGSVLRDGGVLFMVGVVMAMAVCLYNEWRGIPDAASAAA
jgi:hypothetical protein